MTRTRLETLQWFGLFAGPLAFAAQHVAEVFTSLADCNPAGNGWAVPQHPLQLGFTVAAAVVVVAAEAAAYAAFRETREIDQEGEPPLGRIRFLATASLVIGPLFLALVLLSGLGAVAHPYCRPGMRRALLIALVTLAAAAPARADPPPPGIETTAGTSAGGVPAGLAAEGYALYGGNCATCHGSHGEGIADAPRDRGQGDVDGLGPPLTDSGALGADFYLRTGYMPLRSPTIQPSRSRVLFSDRQIRALVAYVASLGHGPPIPRPHPERGALGDGRRLFTEHCAGCHQVVAEGGFVTGARVPPLEDATPTQIAEAVRVGPYVMPAFSERAIDERQLDSIVRYVEYTKHPDDRGGWSHRPSRPRAGRDRDVVAGGGGARRALPAARPEARVVTRPKDLLVAGGVLLLGKTPRRRSPADADRVVRPGEPSPGPELAVIALFGLTALLAIGFVVTYALDANTQLLGLSLGLALLSLAAALIVISKTLVVAEELVESTPSPSTRPSRTASTRSSTRAARGSPGRGS